MSKIQIENVAVAAASFYFLGGYGVLPFAGYVYLTGQEASPFWNGLEYGIGYFGVSLLLNKFNTQA